MSKKTYIFIAITILGFLAGLVLGRYLWPTADTVVSDQIRENLPEYKFIDPLLLITNKGMGKATEYKSVTNKLSSYINDQIAQKNADDASVYFSDLNSGLYSGVNEGDQYFPGSMMKVAVLIVCFQIAEQDPTFLTKEIYDDPKSANLNVNQFYPPQHQIMPGQSYTVQDLINYMILYSDNNATYLLEYLVTDNKINALMKELQLPSLTSIDNNNDFISPQLYSRFYRVLYNSTYLSPGVSEGALELLAEKDFPQGLDAGVPDSINVAQKFGEHTQVDQLGNVINHELHDCGIVYAPNDPYFICVMTKGQDFTKLQPIISNISKMVWSYFSSTSQTG